MEARASGRVPGPVGDSEGPGLAALVSCIILGISSRLYMQWDASAGDSVGRNNYG